VTLETQVGSSLEIRSMRGAMGLSRERLAPLLGVSAKTIERWEARGDLPLSDPLRMSRLTEIATVIELGTMVYTQLGLARFLRLPLAIFDGQNALQLIERGQAVQVLGALASDYEGIGY